MLRSIKAMHGFQLKAKDGEIGKVDEFYFDDHSWTIRYMVADTGSWLIDHKVLISPESLEKPDWKNQVFPVQLTKEQVEKSPRIDNDKPVSRQNEVDLISYYGWPNYWTGLTGPVMGAIHPLPHRSLDKTEEELLEMSKKEEQQSDPNLRSTNEVISYNIKAIDGEIGHVEDFLVDDNNWAIRYIIVDTRNWLPGGKNVILSLDWIKEINWSDSGVKVNLSKDKIKNSPEYDSSKPAEREYETALHEHYDKPKYWEK